VLADLAARINAEHTEVVRSLKRGMMSALLGNWQNCSAQSLLTQPAGSRHSRQHPVPRACLPSLIADRRTREGRGRSARTGPPIPRNFPLRARRHSRRRFRAQPPRTRRQMDCRHIRARNGGSAGGVGHRTHRVDKVSNSASTAPISPMGPMPDTSMPLLSAHRASGLTPGRAAPAPPGQITHSQLRNLSNGRS
jgi:hypothetical protein